MAEERSAEAEAASPSAIWDPFRELDLPRGLEALRGLGAPRLGRALEELLSGGRAEPGSGAVPAVDISEDDERYRLSAELPGATAEDITVESDGNVLTIRGERRRPPPRADRSRSRSRRARRRRCSATRVSCIRWC